MNELELRPYLGEDLRTEEEKLTQRAALRRWQAQALTERERAMSKLHMPLNWEYVFGNKNPKAPDAVWLRKPYKFPYRIKIDREFLEHH